MSKGRNTIQEAGQALGGARRESQMVLARIIHWMEYTTIQIDGVDFVAKTIKELAEEVALPERTVRRHLATLRRLGLIETKYKMFHGKRMGHHRYVKPRSVLGGEPDNVVDLHRGRAQKANSGCAGQATCGRTQEASDGPTHNTEHHRTPTGQQTRRTASEIPMGEFGREEGEIVKDPPRPRNLLRAWEVAYRKTHPGKPVEGFDPKMANLHRAFARQCDDPMKGIFLAVGRWSEFRSRIKVADKAHAPDLPRMETLHKRVEILNDWLAEVARGPKLNARGLPVVG